MLCRLSSYIHVHILRERERERAVFMFLPHISDNNFDRVDIGTSEPLLLDVLINALTQISTE